MLPVNKCIQYTSSATGDVEAAALEIGLSRDTDARDRRPEIGLDVEAAARAMPGGCSKLVTVGCRPSAAS